MLSRSPPGLRRHRDLPSAHTTTKTKHSLVQPNGGWPTDAGVSNNACCWMPLRVFRLVMSHICDRMQVVLRFIFQLPVLQHYHALSLYPLWHVSFGRCDATLLLFMLSFYFTFFWGDLSVFLSEEVLFCSFSLCCQVGSTSRASMRSFPPSWTLPWAQEWVCDQVSLLRPSLRHLQGTFGKEICFSSRDAELAEWKSGISRRHPSGVKGTCLRKKPTWKKTKKRHVDRQMLPTLLYKHFESAMYESKHP